MLTSGITAVDYVRLHPLFAPRLLDDGPCWSRVNGRWVPPGYELLGGDFVVITRTVAPDRQR